MWDEIQTWLVEVGVKKMLPSLIRTSLMALIAYMAAHQNLLHSLGVSWDPDGHTIDIDMDTLSTWLLIAVPGAITALMTAFQHHTGAVIAGKPQDGDMRSNPPQGVVGGDRKEDAPKGA